MDLLDIESPMEKLYGKIRQIEEAPCNEEGLQILITAATTYNLGISMRVAHFVKNLADTPIHIEEFI